MHLMPPCLLDPGRASKRIKHLPHKYLASYDESLYLDNTVRLRLPPAAMFASSSGGMCSSASVTYTAVRV